MSVDRSRERKRWAADSLAPARKMSTPPYRDCHFLASGTKPRCRNVRVTQATSAIAPSLRIEHAKEASATTSRRTAAAPAARTRHANRRSPGAPGKRPCGGATCPRRRSAHARAGTSSRAWMIQLEPQSQGCRRRITSISRRRHRAVWVRI
jgi:hypothetical protein